MDFFSGPRGARVIRRKQLISSVLGTLRRWRACPRRLVLLDATLKINGRDGEKFQCSQGTLGALAWVEVDLRCDFRAKPET